MNMFTAHLALAGAVALAGGPAVALAQVGSETEQEMTPPTTAAELHLQSHTVTVVINNGFATTQIDQVLANPTASSWRWARAR